MSAVDKDAFGTTVEGRTTRALLPQTINEIGRNDVTLLPGAEVLGGIYCRDLEVRGAGCVRGPVLAAGSTRLTVPTGEFSVVGPLVSQLTLTAQAAPGARVRIVGDVSAPRLNLEGAVVYGNVVGTNVTLRRCLVIGLVEAAEDLRLVDSACLTFVARRVETGSNVRLLFCAAGAQEELRLGEALQVETFAAPANGGTAAPADARYVVLSPGEVEHCVTNTGGGATVFFDRSGNG